MMAEFFSWPALTVDCVCFDPRGRVLLIRRRNPPFQNAHALPGGFVDPGERLEAACRRELAEKTGLKVDALHLVGVYSEPGRDPRGHTISVAYLARLESAEPRPGSDAIAAEWIADWRTLELAFDHREIVHAAVAMLDRMPAE